MFRIWNFGHCDLFGICYLEFLILLHQPVPLELTRMNETEPQGATSWDKKIAPCIFILNLFW
jgi:hypothetical protein